jgi:hypothetical protein
LCSGSSNCWGEQKKKKEERNLCCSAIHQPGSFTSFDHPICCVANKSRDTVERGKASRTSLPFVVVASLLLDSPAANLHKNHEATEAEEKKETPRSTVPANFTHMTGREKLP